MSGERVEIRAPFGGNFYRASSPDSDPYVEVGDIVLPEQTVALVEAMKLFQEVKHPGPPGRVVEIKAENNTHVEADQVLMIVKVDPDIEYRPVPKTPEELLSEIKQSAASLESRLGQN